MPGEFGPFHRTQTPTQSIEDGAYQVLSDELWGRIPRPSSGYLQVPTVKAHPGPLPPTEKGIEFFTEVRPFQTRPIVRWREADAGVSAVPDEVDTVKIPARVVRIVQDR